MAAKTPTRHWKQPGQGKNIASPYHTPNYRPVTYCGRLIVNDWSLRDRRTNRALAKYTDEGPELVTCKACLKAGYKHQAFVAAIRGGTGNARSGASDAL